MIGNRQVHHILHHLIEEFGTFSLCIIICTTLCINISYLLVVSAFRSADFTDAFQQIVKIILAEVLTLFQTFIIQDITLNDELLQYRSCPYTELGCLIAVHSITNSNDYIKIVEQRSTLNITLSLQLNLLNFSTSCLSLQFTRLINLRNMISDSCSINTKQSSHPFL